MAAPSVLHDGFLIPNAAGVTDPRLAEPDQVDFSTMANARWGVIQGCEVSPQGATGVFVSSGTAIVDGKLVAVYAKGLQMSVPAADARFDLVVVDEKGEASIVGGTTSLNPIYPDVGINQTLLAAVYSKAGATPPSSGDWIIDKRKFLTPALLTKIDPDDDLIRNFNEPGSSPGDAPKNFFTVKGSGTMVWNNDSTLEWVRAFVMRLVGDLILAGNLQAGGATTTGNIVAGGTIAADNLIRSNLTPTTTPGVLGSGPGDFWQNPTTGLVYIRKIVAGGYEWQEIATTETAVPTGAVIQSLQPPDIMIPLGWYPLNGMTIQESSATEDLFGVAALVAASTITGSAPNRSMKVPNLARRMPLTDFNSPGKFGGMYNNNIIQLAWINMPPHHHSVNAVASGGFTPAGRIPTSGAHTNHTVSGGWHDHVVEDAGHRHESMDWDGIARPVIAVMEGGQNKIDALFNDRSHTYSVEPVRWTMKALSGINIRPSEEHGHVIGGGAHAHVLEMNPVADHDHQMTQTTIGGNSKGFAEPIDFTPQYFTFYTYVRA